MRATRLVVVGMVVATLGTVAACGGGSPAGPSGGPNPTPQGLAGSWRATRAELVNATNSSARVEIVSLGATLVLSLEAGGSYTRTLNGGHVEFDFNDDNRMEEAVLNAAFVRQ